MRLLTRLRSLQALEAAARHGSFVGASSELDVTPAAVGQLVRSLEDWVGYPLFTRSRSGSDRLTPTEEARAALEDITSGLDSLEAGLAKLRGRGARSIVVVTASQALVANWLISKLEDFSTRHPQIDVRLDVADRLNDLEHGEADIGVRCGLGSWSGLKSTRLMDEEVIGVCSPKLLPAGAMVTADWVAQQTLIHDATPHPGGDFPNWEGWLARAGVVCSQKNPGLRINSTSAVIQAAAAARGLALVRRALVAQDLETGRLHHLMPENRWPIRWAYYAVAPSKSLRRAEVRAFHDWLLQQAQTNP